MSGKLTQPQVRRYRDWLRRNDYHGTNSYIYDEKSRKLLDELFVLIAQVTPIAENGARALWLRAARGSIEDYGIASEEVEEGNYDSEEEFIKSWKEWFPDEVEWYYFTAVELKEEGYRAVMLGHSFVIVQDDRRPQGGFPLDISEFVQWLVDGVKDCIKMLKAGTYNAFVQENLPPQHRTGTILRRDYWKVWPDARDSFFEDLSEEEKTEFVVKARAQKNEREKVGRMSSVTANDFFRFCALGYAENRYKGCDKSPKEQYYLHADGRDDDLGDIDPDSPEAFRSWLNDKSRFIGHPWEVCRGGNSTHIDLYVREDEYGFYLVLAGSAWTRTIETVKFYLALTRAGIAVYLNEAPMLVERLTGCEKIGIVPEGVIPAYCTQFFPNEHIIDYMNLPYEDREEFVPYCSWYDEPTIGLVQIEEGETN